MHKIFGSAKTAARARFMASLLQGAISKHNVLISMKNTTYSGLPAL